MSLPGKAGWRTARKAVPGVILLVALAALAFLIGAIIKIGHPLLLAIGIGFSIGNTGLVPKWCQPGINTYGTWLTIGIILIGASLSIQDFTEGGVLLIGIVLVVFR